MIENVKRGDFVWRIDRETFAPKSFLVTRVTPGEGVDKFMGISEFSDSCFSFYKEDFFHTGKECLEDTIDKFKKANNIAGVMP